MIWNDLGIVWIAVEKRRFVILPQTCGGPNKVNLTDGQLLRNQIGTLYTLDEVFYLCHVMLFCTFFSLFWISIIFLCIQI